MVYMKKCIDYLDEDWFKEVVNEERKEIPPSLV
jgi:hypothetical protein